MFYFPVLSSSSEIYEYKESLRNRFQDCLRDMESLVHWEKTLNRETMELDKPAEHEELYIKLKSFVENGH